MGLTGNKGEWSEIYVLLRLLADGRIYAADENLRRLEKVYFPILKIIREEKDKEKEKVETHEYDLKEQGKVQIFFNGNKLKEMETEEFSREANYLYHAIKTAKLGKAKALSVPRTEGFMKNIYCHVLKASSKDKTDITMQVHDIQTGYEPVYGFSIKSKLGSPATLLNASGATNFIYEVVGLQLEDMKEINGIVGQEKILHRMEEIFRRGGKFKYYGMDKSTFEENVMLIDSLMPYILGEALLIYYGEVKKLQVEEEQQGYKFPVKNVEEEAAEYGKKSNHISSCEEVLDMITKRNPLRYPNPENMYKYKFKKLLSAIALGMMPGSKWNGRDQANGGYIIVSHSGDVLAYHIYNRDFFEEYLFRNTKFESPGSDRHRYGDLYEQDGKIFMKLNLQIRFR